MQIYDNPWSLIKVNPIRAEEIAVQNTRAHRGSPHQTD